MRNFCTYCGFRNTPEATACLGCGAPLEAPRSAAPPVPDARITQPIQFPAPPDPRAGPPVQVPGGWYSTQQHTPVNPAEPSAGAVSAWLDGRHAEVPPWPLPPAGGVAPPTHGGPYGGVPQGPYQQPYGPSRIEQPYQGPYGGRQPSPPFGPYPPPAGPYAAPTGYNTPESASPGPYGPDYGHGPYGSGPLGGAGYGGQARGGYVPTPGYSTFSSGQQPRAGYPPVPGPTPYSSPFPSPIYASPYTPMPYGQAGSLADGGQRFGAYLLDSVVLAIPMFFFLSLVSATQSTTLGGMWLLALLLCPAIYFISAWSTTGRTIGYRAMGLRLARTDGGQPSLSAAIARYVTLAACLMFFFPGILGAMWMLWDEKRQAWHDKVADTVVVRT